ARRGPASSSTASISGGGAPTPCGSKRTARSACSRSMRCVATGPGWRDRRSRGKIDAPVLSLQDLAALDIQDVELRLQEEAECVLRRLDDRLARPVEGGVEHHGHAGDCLEVA